jgi:rod shape-determining protein MreC
MQNVSAIFRYLRVFLIFALFQGFALYLYFTSQLYPSIQFANTTRGVSNTLIEAQHAYMQYFGLTEENRMLQKAYQKLLEKSPISFIQLDAKRAKIEDTLFQQNYSYISGEVLRSSTHKANNYITANIGTKHGVKKGMGVINHDGLIGYVYDVSEHYCLVKTLLSENINIDVMLPNGQFGLLKWLGRNPNEINVTGIPNDTEVELGDVFTTRGTGGVFPRGIAVGSVASLNFTEGEANWDLRLKPAVNFKSVKHIYVVNHLHKTELEALEARLEE